MIDLLSPAALDSYWNTNVAPVFKALGPHAGTTLKYVHTDSWEGGGMNWTPGFDRVFRERRGYDPMPWLAVRVKLNGSDLGIAWRPPFRIDVGKSAKAGTNTLEITAINSWCNRVMADDKLPENKRVTQTNIRVQKQGRFKWKPEPSGLIGPVRIVRAADVPERE